jgi:PAS domain S-box-containing protein
VNEESPDRDGGGFEPGFDVYRALVEGIPAVLYIDYLDEWSTNWFTSPQSVEMFGYTAEEWGTTPDLWLKKIHPDDVDRVKAENDRGNETGEPFFSEYRMRTADGRIVWIRDEAWLSRSGGRPHWRGVMLDITAQKEAEEKLRWSLDVLRRTIQQRRELAVRLEGAQEEERRRIAADIHDDPIQAMSAVDLRLSMLAEKGLPADPSLLVELQGIVRRSIERMRSLLFELRPSALEREGLIVALRQYLEHARRDTGWSYDLVDELAAEPGPELRASLYRIAQEAVSNSRKHAAASSLEVRVTTEGDGVTVRIRDDGVGFDASHLEAPTPGHIGLATMIERAELMGGWCRVTSHLGAGTTVECWLPRHDADEHELRPDRSA